MVKARCSNYDCRCELIGWFDEPEEAAEDWNKRVGKGKPPAKIVVEVSGGMVQNVWADKADVLVDVADLDVQDDEDLEAAQDVLDVAKEQGYVCVW
ncbi:MAG: hypothetical protein IJI27_08280 [Oscillospiraceae bacterium]|nr:hypothetical protein [Oscillospiraceae bacterium]